MNIKITTLSPIHIGTGNEILPICYKRTGNKTFRYLEKDVFSLLKPKIYLNADYLNLLTNEAKNKRDCLNALTPWDYSQIKPVYEVIYNGKNDLSKGKETVQEQIKALDRPIIPGSSLKGAIISALIFSYLYDHRHSCKRQIEDFFKYFKNAKLGNTTSLLLFQLLYGNTFINSIGKENLENFLKDLYRTIELQDLTFQNIEVLDLSREHLFDVEKTTPMGQTECIQAGQKIECSPFITINKKSREYVLDKYQNDILREITHYFTQEKNIYNSIKKSTNFIFNSDLQDHMKDFYLDLSELKTNVDFIKDEIRAAGKNNNVFVMRIGKNTSYFFKSLSWFFKTEFPDIYYDNDIFNAFFRPVMTGKAKKKSVEIEEFPVTRTVGYTSASDYMLGYLKVEIC